METAVRFGSHHGASRALKEMCASPLSGGEYLSSVVNETMDEGVSIYIHVPFCNKKCSFCPFHRPDALERKSYDKYLVDEIDRISRFKFASAPVSTVYFGGGTPTSLRPEQMNRVLEKLHSSFNILPDAEISLETAATELNDEMLSVLQNNHVNRLSIGAQTFNDEERKVFGRRGGKERVIEAVERVKRYGIDNVNIDLIYRYPGQTEKMLSYDLDTIISLSLAGLSFYPLMLHKKTPLDSRLSEKEKEEFDDVAKERDFFYQIVSTLRPHGFKLLELNKLVRNGMDKYKYMSVRHNHGSCIALGHGAGGNIRNYYYSNSCDVPFVSDDIPISSKGRVVSDSYRILDSMIYSLEQGHVDFSTYSNLLSFDIIPAIAPLLDELEEKNLILRRGSEIELTVEGVFWGNNIIDEIVTQLLAKMKHDA